MELLPKKLLNRINTNNYLMAVACQCNLPGLKLQVHIWFSARISKILVVHCALNQSKLILLRNYDEGASLIPFLSYAYKVKDIYLYVVTSLAQWFLQHVLCQLEGKFPFRKLFLFYKHKLAEVANNAHSCLHLRSTIVICLWSWNPLISTLLLPSFSIVHALTGM